MTDPKVAAELVKPAAKGLYAKLAAIQAATQAVDKTGHVEFGKTKFDHFQEHGLLAIVKPLLEEHGLALIPDAPTYTRDGNSTIVQFTLTLHDPATGESVTTTFPNEGVDSGDKAFNKAYTGAMKYALQKLFLIPTDKVDEQEGSDEKHNQQRTPAKDVGNATMDEDALSLLRDLIAESEMSDEDLQLQLLAVGADNLQSLTNDQGRELWKVVNAVRVGKAKDAS